MRKPQTYSRLLRRFHVWTAAQGWKLFFPDDVDRAATAFSASIGHGEASQLLAALLKAYPPLRGQLPWLASTVRHRHLRSPPTHHPPMSWPVALGIATGLRLLGYPRDASLLLLQWRLGLRPGEALRLIASDISLPACAGRVGIVRLGARFGTKLRRVQFARAYPGDTATLFLLYRIVACRRPEEHVGNSLTTPQYTGRLRRGARRVGLPPLWTAHCPRAGWCTARHLHGQPFGELREDGRWSSDRSLRIYIDAVASVDIDTSVASHAGWLAALEARFFADYYWV